MKVRCIGAPVHALGHATGRRGGLALEGHIPGRDAVAPPELPADAPVPDVLQPPGCPMTHCSHARYT